MQRSVMIIAVLLGLGAMASIALRPTAPVGNSPTQPQPAVSVPVAAPVQPAQPGPAAVAPANPLLESPSAGATSSSGPADWVMEGSNPARTRVTQATMALPLTKSRELGVVSADESGSPPVIAAGMLLAETTDALRAFDLETGRQRWAVTQNGAYISPAVAGNLVFFRSESNNKGQLIALDLQSGKQVWSFTPKRLSSAQNNYYGGHLASPVIVDGVVFVGAGKEVYALDAKTGALRWEFAAQDFVTSSATVAGGQIYISDFRYFYAIDQQRGTLRWSYPIKSSFSFAPIASGSTVLLTNGENLNALDVATGKLLWTMSIAGEVLVPAAADSSRAFVKSTETLYALELESGKELWRFHDTNFVSLPAVTSHQVFVVSGMGANTVISAIDATNGQQAWAQPVGSLATTAPVIAGRTVYVRTTDGKVLGFWS